MRTIEAIKYDLNQAIISLKYAIFAREMAKTNKGVFVSAIYTSAGAILLNTRGQRLLARSR